MNGPIIEGGVRVCASLCSTCIFRPRNLMHLRRGRVRAMVEAVQAADSAIVCHKTLDGERAICRGWLDAQGGATIMGRLALAAPIEIDPG